MKTDRSLAAASFLLVVLQASQCFAARGVVDVRDFGAKGDGKSDDTAAFVKALGMGGSLYAPAGTYLIGPKPLKLPENVVLRGDSRGTVLKPAPNTAELLLLGAGAQVCDLAIDGRNVKSGSVTNGLIVLRYADGGRIDSVVVTDCDRACVMTDHADDLTIRDCEFRNVGMGISLQFSNRVKVLGNRVVNARIHGIQFWGNWRFESIQSEDLIFANNYVKDGGGGPIWGAGGRRVIIRGNIVDGAKDVGLDLEWCEDSVISGNIARRCANAGISLFFACKRVSITGNTVINDRPVSDKDKAAIFTVLQRRLTDKEKVLPWYVRSGIWLTPPNRQKLKSDHGHEDIAIVGNTIHTIDDDIPRRDIWVGSEVKNVRIEGNTLSGHGIFYGGHHMIFPQRLERLTQPIVIDKRPTPDKPKF